MTGQSTLKQLQDKLRRSGTWLLLGVFCVLGVIICRQITQVMQQNYDDRFTDARELMEKAVLESTRVDLEQLSLLEQQYGVFLYLYNRGEEIELPYSISEQKEAWQPQAAALIQSCRGTLLPEEDQLQKESSLAGVRASYTMQRLESGQTAELLILQPNDAMNNAILRACLGPTAALLLACLLLIAFYRLWLTRAFAPAYAAQKAQLDFLSLAGHELRTPVTVIRSNTELLAQGKDSSRDMLRNIQTETLRMDVLIEDLILFSRVQTKNLRLNLQRVDACELLLDCYTRFYPLLNAEGRHLILQPPPEEDVSLQADPMRLGQLLGILVSNANAHTPEGTTVTLGLEQKDGWVELYVQDDGPGLPPDSKQSGTVQGTHLGVGLPIARELAKMQGGILLQQNRCPHGARLAFRFPLMQDSH